MTGAGPRGAIFDLDGTLLDTERLLLEAMDAVALADGRGDLRPAFRQVLGLRMDLAAAHLTPALGGHAAYEEFAARVEVRHAEAKTAGIPLKTHAREVLEAVAAREVPMALATSTHTAQADALLEKTGLRGFFSAVIGGDQVERPKPHPEIYIRAAAALGLSAQHCAAFEDSAPGTRAAIAAGCITVQVPDIAEPDDGLRRLGHHIAPDLHSAAIAVRLLPDHS
ncbi:MAG: HAD family phosphatase [Pseudomonadota bacterium]